MPTRSNTAAALAAAAMAATAVAIVLPGSAGAVETPISISTSSLDFGSVNVGSTSSKSVTLTNTGGSPFGPINMFGGAPPSVEYGASQNCQGQTLPPGGSCSVNYNFTPSAVGQFNDSSNFTISQTSSQSDGENFSVSLTGRGRLQGVQPPIATGVTLVLNPDLGGGDSTPDDSGAPSPTTTTLPATTTTGAATATTEPTTATTQPSGGGSSSGGSSGGGGTDTSQPATGDSTTTTTLQRQVLTGIVEPRPAIVVKVDNVDATPQAGLNQADIVFEEIVEGRATRFAAVFHTNDVNPVGPVRSARTQDVDLLLSLNDPALAYSGANEAVNGALAGAGIEVFGEGSPGFFRVDDRPAPHNLFVNLSAIRQVITSSGDAVPAFQYLAPGDVLAGTPVTFASLMVGSYDVRWDWDATLGQFLRSQLGGPHLLVDGRVSADSVVVLVVPYGTDPAGGPEAQTVGSGQAIVFTDGQRIDGTWTRASNTVPFTLEANGQPILLAPGRTWVELADGSNNLTSG